jgi:hypothetical protein
MAWAYCCRLIKLMYRLLFFPKKFENDIALHEEHKVGMCAYS